MRRMLAVAALACCALAFSACAAPVRPGSPAPGPTPSPGAATSPVTPGRTPGVGGGTSLAPGLYNESSGTPFAIGWVVHEDIEGGFWALVTAPPSPQSVGRPVVVLLPGKEGVARIAALNGQYARASGLIATGVSSRSFGPEMTVDSIAAVTDYRPK
jgi:hypothetical protein